MSSRNPSPLPDFNPGDLVRLKSGGPQMTIARINSTHLQCFWFNGKKIEQYVVPVLVVEKAGRSDQL